MDIVIPDYEQKLIDKKRKSLTVRLSALEDSALTQVFWAGQQKGSSLSSILRAALCEFLKNHYNLNIPDDFKSVDEQ